MITLPIPTRLNRLYRFTCKRGYPHMYKSKEATDWIEEAGWILKSKWNKETITDSVALYIKLYVSHRSDIDGVLKIFLDLLQEIRIIEDDKQIYKLTIEKYKTNDKSEDYIEFDIFIISDCPTS